MVNGATLAAGPDNSRHLKPYLCVTSTAPTLGMLKLYDVRWKKKTRTANWTQHSTEITRQFQSVSLIRKTLHQQRRYCDCRTIYFHSFAIRMIDRDASGATGEEPWPPVSYLRIPSRTPTSPHLHDYHSYYSTGRCRPHSNAVIHLSVYLLFSTDTGHCTVPRTLEFRANFKRVWNERWLDGKWIRDVYLRSSSVV